MNSLPDPNACRWCALPRRGHFQQREKSVGWHRFIEPTDRQRLERMKARRAARTAARDPKSAYNGTEITVTVTVEDTFTPAIQSIRVALARLLRARRQLRRHHLERLRRDRAALSRTSPST